MTHRFIYIAGIVMLCFSGSARAVVIFDDFGPGNSVSDLLAYCVEGALYAPECSENTATILEPAALFVSTGNYEVTQIDVTLFTSEGTNSAVASLFTDVSSAPGVLLGSFSVSGGTLVTTVSGITGITLSSGASYFLQISPAVVSSEVFWSANDTGATGQVYDPPFGGPNLSLPAFDVLGTAVSATPEPGSWALIGLGLTGLGIARLCGRDAIRKSARRGW